MDDLNKFIECTFFCDKTCDLLCHFKHNIKCTLSHDMKH